MLWLAGKWGHCARANHVAILGTGYPPPGGMRLRAQLGPETIIVLCPCTHRASSTELEDGES